MKLKAIATASLVTIALVFSACGKKNEGDKRPSNPATPNNNNVSIPVPAGTQNLTPIDTSITAIEGTWWTSCAEEAGLAVARKIVANKDVLSFGAYSYANMAECNYDLTGEEGKLEETHYTRFRLVALQDSVMTHRLEYVRQDGSVLESLVIRVEKEGKQFLASHEGFLTSRDTAEYFATFYKY